MNPTPLILTLLLTCPLLLSLLPVAAPADAATDKAALLALRAALRGRWNLTGSNNHCQWKGVVCDQSGRVIELHLPGVGFVGTLPSNVIGNLTQLVFLSLRFNALTGTLPNDLASCVKLKYVYFQGNRLSGGIPTVIFQLKNVLRINLAGNRFSGEIPTDFNKITKLDTLYLEQNNLTGVIPDIKLPNLKQFNVSYNNLTGDIPPQFCTFPVSSFEGNSLSPCPEKISPTPGPAPGPGPGPSGNGHDDDEKEENGNNKSKLSGLAIAGIVIGSLLALLILLSIIFLLCGRKKSKQENGSRSIASIAGGGGTGAANADVEEAASASALAVVGPTTAVAARKRKSGAGKTDDNNKKLVFIGNAARLYDLDDLLRASAEVLGKGNFGTTYKAALDNGVDVVVKRLKDVAVSEDEFEVKMEEIGRLEHENLVGLRAYHSSHNERLLVYDYFPLGSLSSLLHGNRGNTRTPLNWETRSTIALGAARGIAYIHSHNPTLSHGNIKLSNILLSNSYEARVSDFGLSQLAAPTASSPNRIAGYRAPEVTDSRKISQKADVYSFGIFLLELLTAKAPTYTILNEVGVDLPRWVQSKVQEARPSEVFDPELLRYQNAEEDMNRLLQLALDCTAQYPDSRPSMTEVANGIQDICRTFSSARPSQDVLADLTSDA